MVDALPKKEYDKNMQEIAALTPKQQRKWKGYSTDKCETRTRLRYYNGKLESYSVRVHQWVPCVCTEEMLENDGGWTPVSTVGVAAIAEVNTGIKGLIDRAMNHAREGNHTGNHYRNHKIKVPTAAGEPVRG